VTLLFATVVIVGGTASSCDPCAGLATPSQSEIATNPDIEAQGRGGAECDYEDGEWSADDDSHSKPAKAKPKTAKKTPPKSNR
jgi:hypothetical protein